MKRASYREAIELIAMNDGPGDSGAHDVQAVSGLVTVGLIADLFGVDQEKVARDVVRFRMSYEKAHPVMVAMQRAGRAPA